MSTQSTENFFAVAVDGPSGAGKSTIAKAVAAKLNILYVDTGAIYRSIGCAVLRAGIDPAEKAQVLALLPQLRLSLHYGADGLQHMLLDGEDITERIRLPEISMYASKVSAYQEVRTFLMDMQRDFAKKGSVIMDGRDIGTVVLPDAQVKIFLTASAQVRAQRRCAELAQRGTPKPLDEVLREIEQRDYNDTHRAAAPLRAAEDAVTVDTSALTFAESCEKVLSVIKERLQA